MKRIKVMTVFGTRPEAIKMAPLVKELEKHGDFESLVCVTAQHREMLDQVLEMFHITPQYDLDIMKERQTLTGTTIRALEGLEKVMLDAKPDCVLVHGDTLTTFVTSLAAFYQQIPVGHVEAGLRTFNKYFPFPEEMNRKLTGVMADLHFAPTETAKQNLRNENVSDKDIFITGNTVIDAMGTTIEENYTFNDPALNRVDFNKKVIVMTAHRRENLGEPLHNICRAVRQIILENEDVEVVYAVHKNPAVREVVYEILGSHPRIHLLEPIDFKDMHNLMNRAYLVLTDSGGLQEEAPSLGKPILVLRKETERPEGIEAGTAKLAGTEEEEIYRLATELIQDEEAYRKMANAINPYGDGKASLRIVEAILYYFQRVDKKPTEFSVNPK